MLVSSAYNGVTQRVQCELRTQGYDVKALVVSKPSQIQEGAQQFQPDLILAPMLKTEIPESVWKSTKSLILHPGIKGDRGPSSLDWAII